MNCASLVEMVLLTSILTVVMHIGCLGACVTRVVNAVASNCDVHAFGIGFLQSVGTRGLDIRCSAALWHLAYRNEADCVGFVGHVVV